MPLHRPGRSERSWTSRGPGSYGWGVLRPFNRSIHLWLLAFAAAGFTYFGVQAVLFNLYLLRLGFEPQFIGLLIGSGQLVFALAALPSGELGRRVGVRGAFAAGMVLLGLAY